MPRGTDAEKAARRLAIDTATLGATRIPFRVVVTVLGVMPLIKLMAEQGQPSSVSDAGVGALCARAAVMGAYLNVQINAASLKGNAEAAELVAKGAGMAQRAQQLEDETLAVVRGKM